MTSTSDEPPNFGSSRFRSRRTSPLEHGTRIGVSFPSLLQYPLGAALVIVGVPIIYLLSRVFKLRPILIIIANPKREATLAIGMIVAGTVVRAVWGTFVFTIYLPALQLSNHLINNLQGGQTIDVYDILPFLLLHSVVILMLVIAMRRTGQKLGSIGVARANLGRMLALGFSLGAVNLLIAGSVNPLLGARFVGFSSTLLYGLVLFTMVGFVEEVVWRGYIQTRLIARIGKLKGLVVTSLAFAVLWHFPVSFYAEASGDVLGAVAYASLRFFPALIFGYVMIRSQNIIPSSILHLFYDWNTILWY